MLGWIALWTIIFSGVDFWTIKLFDVCHYSWFEEYRAVMRFGVSWISPPSFALAENAYFLWVNAFDPHYTMHEWEFYTGNPANPDGHFNFVWGDDHGGWMKFPMAAWYGGWLLPSVPWFIMVGLFLSGRLNQKRDRAPRTAPAGLQPALETVTPD